MDSGVASTSKKMIMRILLIGPRLPVGGFGRFINDFYDFCSSDQLVELAIYNIARPLKKKVKSYRIGSYASIINAGWWRLLRSLAKTFSNIARFPRFLSRVNPRIIYFTVGGNIPFWDAYPFLVFVWRTHARVIFHWLGPLEPFYQRSSRLVRRLIHLALQRVDASIVLSRRDAELLSKIAPTKPVVYIPSSVDTKAYESSRTLHLLSNPDHFVDLLFLGGVDPYRKGLMTLLDALPHIIAEATYPIRLVVTGSDVSKEILEHSEAQIRKHIVFLGWVKEEDKIGLYKTCDLMILPSFDEGMPYALVEAMAAGLPVVSTLVGGIPDLIQDGINGFLVRPGQPLELADRIIRLVNDPNLRKAISETNRRLAREQYSVQAMFRQIKQLCESLVNTYDIN